MFQDNNWIFLGECHRIKKLSVIVIHIVYNTVKNTVHVVLFIHRSRGLLWKKQYSPSSIVRHGEFTVIGYSH